MSAGVTNGGSYSGRTAWARSIPTPLRAFLTTETGGAAVLLAAAVAALAWVNIHADSYESLWETTLSIEVGGDGVSLSLREWVNSGLMTFFFLRHWARSAARVRSRRAARTTPVRAV